MHRVAGGFEHAADALVQRVLEAFDKAGVPLFVAYYRRALARFLKAKELIDAGGVAHVVGPAAQEAQLIYLGADDDFVQRASA